MAQLSVDATDSTGYYLTLFAGEISGFAEKASDHFFKNHEKENSMKKQMRATRHNGRSGVHGTYDPKHNDREFNVKNSDHIKETLTDQNVYWDCYQGYYFPSSGKERQYSFSEVEKFYYREHYGDHVFAQNLRNEEARHSERNRKTEDLLKNKKTCPEESLLQLGNIDGTVPPGVLAQISAEYFEEFEKRFGSHIHILDWALHLDETTPHIHERHVFDALNEYGELCPMQDKALAELGFELPDPAKEKGRYNNRKMSFDAECRRMFLEICKKHGLDIDMEPIYGGKSYLEKADYIAQKLRDENEKLTAENKQLRNENDDLVMKISDVKQFLDDVAVDAYEKACEVVTDTVRSETQKADVELIADYEDRIIRSSSSPEVKRIAAKIFAGIKDLFAKAAEKILGSIRRTLADPAVKEKNISAIREKNRESVLAKLAHFKKEADNAPKAHDTTKHILKEGERS